MRRDAWREIQSDNVMEKGKIENFVEAVGRKQAEKEGGGERKKTHLREEGDERSGQGRHSRELKEGR